MCTRDLAQENVAKIREMFPNCVTEARDDETGGIRLVVDCDQLRQELSGNVVEGPQERYRLDWPGKRIALATANAPTNGTFRPARAESVQFKTTKNLFIEGDNLESLKLLQRAYDGRIKLIYIDPPYNTGDSKIYKDDYSESRKAYLARSGQIDSKGGNLLSNRESNGRFHSDWMTMMYARLSVARRLLSDDGAIFISIDEGEKSNLCKICDEVFGKKNFRNTILVRRRVKSLNVQFAARGLQSMNVGYEYVLIYAKSELFLMNALRRIKDTPNTTGKWDGFWSNADRPTMRYELLGFTPQTGQWRWAKDKAYQAAANYQKFQSE